MSQSVVEGRHPGHFSSQKRPPIRTEKTKHSLGAKKHRGLLGPSVRGKSIHHIAVRAGDALGPVAVVTVGSRVCIVISVLFLRGGMSMTCACRRGLNIEYHVLSPPPEGASEFSSSSCASPESFLSSALTSVRGDAEGGSRGRSTTDRGKPPTSASPQDNGSGTKEDLGKQNTTENDLDSAGLDGRRVSSEEGTILKDQLPPCEARVSSAPLDEYNLPSGMTVSALLLPHSRRRERMYLSKRWRQAFLTSRKTEKDKLGKPREYSSEAFCMSPEQDFSLPSECRVGVHSGQNENPLLRDEELSGGEEQESGGVESRALGCSRGSAVESRKLPLSAKSHRGEMPPEDDREKKKKRVRSRDAGTKEDRRTLLLGFLARRYSFSVIGHGVLLPQSMYWLDG